MNLDLTLLCVTRPCLVPWPEADGELLLSISKPGRSRAAARCLTHFVFITYTDGVNRLSGFPAGLHLQQSISATNVCVNGVPGPRGETAAHRFASHTHTHAHTDRILATLPGLMEALVSVVLQQRPGDAVV